MEEDQRRATGAMEGEKVFANLLLPNGDPSLRQKGEERNVTHKASGLLAWNEVRLREKKFQET